MRRIEELTICFCNSTIFSKLDHVWIFPSTRGRGEDGKNGFSTYHGHYECSMPFDLINASSTFKWWTRYWHHYQQIRASLFWLYHQLLFIKTRALLSSKRSPPTVRENHLISKKKKWFFHFKSLEFSGHIIDKDGIQIDRAEISKIRDWSTSTTIK